MFVPNDPWKEQAQKSTNPAWRTFYAKQSGNPIGYNPDSRKFDLGASNPALDKAFEQIGGQTPSQPMTRPMTPEMMGKLPTPGQGLQGGQMMIPQSFQQGPWANGVQQQLGQQYSPGQAAGGQPQRVSPGMYRMPDGSIQATPGGQAPQPTRPATPQYGKPQDPFGLDGGRLNKYMEENPGRRRGQRNKGRM